MEGGGCDTAMKARDSCVLASQDSQEGSQGIRAVCAVGNSPRWDTPPPL